MLIINPGIPQTNVASVNFDQGTFRDDASPNDGTGTPLIQKWPNDIYYALYAVLKAAGINPSGTQENSNQSDFLNAVKYLTSSSSTLIRPTQIISDTILSSSDLNSIYEVNCNTGSVDINITLPQTIPENVGKWVKLYKYDSTDKILKITANGSELISSYNQHHFYNKDSWVLLRQYNDQWVIDDYYDSKSIFWLSRFSSSDSAQTISSTNLTNVIFPTISTNIASSYNNSTGIATFKIRGYWNVISNVTSDISGNFAGSIAKTTTFFNNTLIDSSSSSSLYTNNSSDFLGLSNSSSYTAPDNDTQTVNIKAASIKIARVSTSSSAGSPFFSGTLIKRLV